MLNLHRVSRDASQAFFARLPAEKLTDQEDDLLNLLHQVADAVQALLPPGVSLQEWAEQRIPEEAMAQANSSRMVHVEHAKPPAKAGTWNRRAHELRLKHGSAQREEFFDSLPADSLLPWEEKLRGSVESVLKLTGRNRISLIAEHPATAPIIRANLRGVVTFEEWMSRRVDDHFELAINEDNETVVTKKGGFPFGTRDPKGKKAWAEEDFQAQEEDLQAQEAEVEEFFESLPDDSYSAEESALRSAVISVLEEKWPVTANELGTDIRVLEAKNNFLPKQMRLRYWCERRMGEEIDFRWSGDAKIGTVVGFKEELDQVDLTQLVESMKSSIDDSIPRMARAQKRREKRKRASISKAQNLVQEG